MKRGLDLAPEQRARLLVLYRGCPDPEVRIRSHILLLLGDGHTWATVATLLFCSSRTIGRRAKRFHAEGVEAVAGHRPGRRPRLDPTWVELAVGRVTKHAPRDFGSLRGRWGCEAASLPMGRLHRARVGRETVRRRLRRGDLACRRPRPILGPRDPGRQGRLGSLRDLLASRPAGETAVSQDEVGITTNPGIGSMWMVRGQQAQVETPGNDEKRYLPGSIGWRAGRVLITQGKPRQGRDTALSLEHLDDLRSRLGGHRKVHVICDRARCHTSGAVAIYLWGHRDRIDLHPLPAYGPGCNPIERVWWHLHEAVTRDHRCQSMQELLDLTFAWLGERNPFPVESLSADRLAA